MNISEVETYHGAVMNRIVSCSQKPFVFERYPTKSNCSYIFDNKIGLYIKYSKKRLSPWTFSFNKNHQDEIKEMKDKLGSVFTVLVCGSDGIIGLDYSTLKEILDEDHSEVEWIRVARTRNTKYTVTGSNGALRLKVGMQDFPKNLFDSTEEIKTTQGYSGFFKSIFSSK